MLRVPAPRVAYAIAFFALSLALLVLVRPSFAFTPDGKIKPFGVRRPAADDGGGADPTLLPLGVAVVVLAVLSLYLFAMLDLVGGRGANGAPTSMGGIKAAAYVHDGWRMP